MSKIFSAVLESKKTQHPEGVKSVTVIVSDKMKKDAEVKAVSDLAFWDPEHHKLYKKPKMTELTGEDAQDQLNEYLSSKEAHGQTDLHDTIDEDSDSDLGSIADVRAAIVNHKDYANCANPYEPSSFINSVVDNVQTLISDSDVDVSFRYIASNISKLEEMRGLVNLEFVRENIVQPVIDTKKRVNELATHAQETFKDSPALETVYKAGQDAPDYSKPKDAYIEVSKYELINNEVLRVGVGVYGDVFLASYDINIREKDTGVLQSTCGSITNFANKVFKNHDNAVDYAYGMAIDKLLERIQYLNKNLMNKDAKALETQVNKLISADKKSLFGSNRSSATTPIIPEFCDMPAELTGKQVQENLPEPQESLPVATKNEPDQPINEPETGKEYGDKLLSLPADAINVYQHLFANCLATVDGHNDYSAEQYEEAGSKLEIIFDEYKSDYSDRFDEEKTKTNLLNIDWDDANECAKSFLNIRSLRSVMRENAEINPEVEKASEPETKPQTAPETKPLEPLETKPTPAPETKPAAPEETKSAAVEYELAPAIDIFETLLEILDEQDQDKVPEPTQLEKDIAAHNEKIAALNPGEKVVFDDLPNLVYHGSDGVSSTQIKDACVSLMYYNGVNNTGEIEKARGVHFDVGNLAHTLTLEPEMVELEYKVKPDVPEPTEPQRKKYEAWLKDGKPENQNLKPNDKVIAAVEEWIAQGRPENQSLKPSDKVIDAVEDWIADGRPENQNLKPSDDVITKVENYTNDPENNPAPTEKQKQKFAAWMNAGYPEPYSSKPTDKQIDEYETWANAGKPEPYKGKPTDKQLADYNAWADAGKPEPYKDKPSDICIERCAFWDQFLAANENMIIVSKEDWKIAQDMADSVRNHNLAGKFIKHPARVSERSHYAIDEETGLLKKARPDIEIGKVLGDLKTIQLRGNPDEEWLAKELEREIKRRKYHLSAAMYMDVTGAKKFVWIFVNKEPGYHWVAFVEMSIDGIYSDDGDYIESLYEQGMRIYRNKLNAIKLAQETNEWLAPVSIQNAITI